MFNKIYKTIHSRYSKFFNFIFFLRYLITIFFISILTFLIIPNYFNYEKRAEILKNHLLQKYSIEISEYEKIKFHSLPVPMLEFYNSTLNLKSTSASIKVKNFKIYPKLLNIYNYQNFQSKKIIFQDNNLVLEYKDLRMFFKSLANQKNKLSLKNLDLNIINNTNSIIKLEDIQFTNFGYNKNLITGKVFGRNFKIENNDNFKKIFFKLDNSGLSANINFDESKKNNLISGIFKSKILNTNLKFNFDYDGKKFNIYKSYFRSKNLAFKNNTIIIFKPYFNISSFINIEQIDKKLFKELKLVKIFESKNLLKNLNSRNEINFKSIKLYKGAIKDAKLKIDFAYGRMNFIKYFSIEKNRFECAGNLNFLDEYPLLFFNCFLKLKEKKSFLKAFAIKEKAKNENLELKVLGNLNILNKKINFKEISINDEVKIPKEDLKYLKKNFERFLLNETFLDIFELKKIKNFILEIS